MNLLPAFSVTGAAKENIPSKWYPKTSLSSSKDLTYLGVSGDAKQTPPLVNNSNPPCLPPPNERYIVDNKYDSSNPSPLGNLHRYLCLPVVVTCNLIRNASCNPHITSPSVRVTSQRTSAGPSEIVLPDELTREPKAVKVSLDNRKDLVLGVYNMSSSAPMQLFVHRGASSIQGTSVGPGSYLARYVKRVLSRSTLISTSLLQPDGIIIPVVHMQAHQREKGRVRGQHPAMRPVRG